jgi:hypothetical protein
MISPYEAYAVNVSEIPRGDAIQKYLQPAAGVFQITPDGDDCLASEMRPKHGSERMKFATSRKNFQGM